MAVAPKSPTNPIKPYQPPPPRTTGTPPVKPPPDPRMHPAPAPPAHQAPPLTKAAQDYLKSLNAIQGGLGAQAIIMEFLNQYGLGSLASWAWQQYLALGGGPDAITQIQLELPTQHAFQVRFPAYAALAKAGHAMSPADMIAMENAYSQALHGAGLPTGFYDSPADFAQFMEDQVSPAEVAQRAQLAATAVLQDDPQVLKELQMMGVPSGHQIAYFLDPTKALPLIQNVVLAAQDAAAGVTTGFGQINAAQAMKLAQQGITAQQATGEFSQLGLQRGLFAGTTSEGSNISTQEQLDAGFGGNVQAQQRIQARQAQRLADFKGNGGFNPTNTGVAGLGKPA